MNWIDKMKYKGISSICVVVGFICICYLVIGGISCRDSESDLNPNGQEIELYVDEGSPAYYDYEEPEEEEECDEIGSYREESSEYIYQVHEDCGICCYACVKRSNECLGPCKLFPGPVPKDFMCGCYEGKCRWFRYK